MTYVYFFLIEAYLAEKTAFLSYSYQIIAM